MISLLFVFVAVLVGAGWWYYKAIKLRNHLNQRIDNIYVVGLNDPDNIPLELEHIANMCIFVSSEWVDATIAKWNKRLAKSQNPLYHSKHIAEKRRMKVIGYIFQDAEYINETEAEYHKRVRASIEEDKASVHYFLKLSNPTWYAIYGNKQKGIRLV